jgi:hypothetical protein
MVQVKEFEKWGIKAVAVNEDSLDDPKYWGEC